MEASGPPASGTAVRFERWAEHYDASQLQRVLYEPVHREVAAGIDGRGRLLDIGCGTGRLLRYLAGRRQGLDLVGLDASTAMAARARTAAGTARVVVGRAERLPFAAEVFDVVLVTLSLSHWDDPGAGLAEIGRVCRPGALIMIADVMCPGELGRAMRARGLTVTSVRRVPSVAGIVEVGLLVAGKPRGP
ncbi:class I SAM-dependent methyltransferase [Actinocorallia longicatena]|uniref:Methyltransferase type 11 domain-containing protein n=1 Tax=Actinocorallia longicatena TaxID=111803 RepID=A0ABP6PVH1_9ACTN